MIPYLRAFFYDEAAFQRYSVVGLFLLGTFLSSGGVIPFTDIVLDSLAGPNLQKVGKALVTLALYLTAGGGLPTPTRPT